MILRRLSEAIRKQNWFAIVLEILILVVGIFVGLQVNDWNQVRQDRTVETRYLERQGLLERDAEHSYLTLDNADEDPMDQLRGHSITYRIAVGPQQGRKVFTLQTLPDERDADDAPAVGNVAGFSLHAAVAAKASQRDKLERLCRCYPAGYC